MEREDKHQEKTNSTVLMKAPKHTTKRDGLLECTQCTAYAAYVSSFDLQRSQLAALGRLEPPDATAASAAAAIATSAALAAALAASAAAVADSAACAAATAAAAVAAASADPAAASVSEHSAVSTTSLGLNGGWT